ncbi:putative UPF0481 protein [Acorus calamus]|uniref:UPF0481 protein n=1 Tax=Acorus calamus TaxID=4465 RepID=A0AAV9CUS5_ACOCL|nr:putative UPF0481 protein [Acorus calamus]
MVIEVHEIEDSLSSELNRSFVPCWREEPATIFRVPPNLRNHDTKAYDPTILSIGPYHRGKNGLMDLERRKQRMARRLFSQHPEAMAVKKVESRARSCYAEEIKMGSEEFVKMLILDGCFIIGLLLCTRSIAVRQRRSRRTGEVVKWNLNPVDFWVLFEGKDEEPEMDAMANSLSFWNLLFLDILKVENQIPMFVVEVLYDLLVVQVDGENVSSIDLAKAYLGFYHWSMFNVGADKEIFNLFHLSYIAISPISSEKKPISPVDPGSETTNQKKRGFRNLMKSATPFAWMPSFVVTKGQQQQREGIKWLSGWMPNATEMQEAGIRFVRKEHVDNMYLSFKDGVMEIPTLYINDNIVPRLRNLIAFEQCYPTDLYISYYSLLMDNLIYTTKDVKVLRDAGILVINRVSDEEVVRIFNNNRMSKDVYAVPQQKELDQVYYDVNKYCDSRWHKWRAVLARDYFDSPWKIISIVAAVILLALTVLQTYYTIADHY